MRNSMGKNICSKVCVKKEMLVNLKLCNCNWSMLCERDLLQGSMV